MALGHWQRPDGFPSDEYFSAVAAAVRDRDIRLAGSPRRESASRYGFEIDRESFERGALGWVAHRVLIHWSCDEDDEPTDHDDFGGYGWSWTVIQANDIELFTFPRQLSQDSNHRHGIAHLTEPDIVASIIDRVLAIGR